MVSLLCSSFLFLFFNLDVGAERTAASKLYVSIGITLRHRKVNNPATEDRLEIDNNANHTILNVREKSVEPWLKTVA